MRVLRVSCWSNEQAFSGLPLQACSMRRQAAATEIGLWISRADEAPSESCACNLVKIAAHEWIEGQFAINHKVLNWATNRLPGLRGCPF